MQSDNDDYVQSIEEEYLQCIENENDQSEIQFLTEREAHIRNVWTLFQDSATAVAQLYRGKVPQKNRSHLNLGNTKEKSPYRRKSKDEHTRDRDKHIIKTRYVIT